MIKSSPEGENANYIKIYPEKQDEIEEILCMPDRDQIIIQCQNTK